jgi:hypothetical protein
MNQAHWRRRIFELANWSLYHQVDTITDPVHDLASKHTQYLMYIKYLIDKKNAAYMEADI